MVRGSLRPAKKDRTLVPAEGLEKAWKGFKPDLVVYNAGTDVFIEDDLGGMCLSVNGIVRRDETVFRFFGERDVPVLMVLSGGYTRESARIIGRSIKNLLENVL